MDEIFQIPNAPRFGLEVLDFLYFGFFGCSFVSDFDIRISNFYSRSIGVLGARTYG